MMSSIIVRGSRLYVKIKTPLGEWRRVATEFDNTPDGRRGAEALLVELNRTEGSLSTRRRASVRDHLYAIESSCGHIKFGRAIDVDVRFRSLVSSCPPSVHLSILAVAERCGPLERDIHEAFARFRIRGEWFSSAAADYLRHLLSRGSFATVARALAKEARTTGALGTIWSNRSGCER